MVLVAASKYSDEDLSGRLLAALGKNVEVAVYRHPKSGQVLNVALENVDDCVVIADFDLPAEEEQ